MSPPAPADESCANLLPWSERWADRRIGFHLEDDVNGALAAHGAALLSRDRAADDESLVRVFVPLCGKARDMAFLSRHERVQQVVGVEGIEKALVEFAQEHPTLQIKEQQEAPTESSGAFSVFQGNNIMLLKGDFFQLTEQNLGGKVDAVFDRGSLVAIQPDMREAYVKVMQSLMARGGKILLVALEHQEGKGPPFAVDEAEVRRLYQDWAESIEQLNPNETEVDQSGRLERLYMIRVK